MPDIQPLTADAQQALQRVLTGAFTTANIAIIQAQIAKIIEIATSGILPLTLEILPDLPTNATNVMAEVKTTTSNTQALESNLNDRFEQLKASQTTLTKDEENTVTEDHQAQQDANASNEKQQNEQQTSKTPEP